MNVLSRYIAYIDSCIIARTAMWKLFRIPLLALWLIAFALNYFQVSETWRDRVVMVLFAVGAAHLLAFVFRRAVFIPEDHPAYIEKAPNFHVTLADRARVSLRMIKDVLK